MPWYCKNCIKDITPFSNLTDVEFEKLINGKTLIPKRVNENHESFFDQVHCLVENDDVIDCKYYDINKFKGLKLHENNEKLSLLHMNISSLPYHFDNFQQLVLNLKIEFDIVGITHPPPPPPPPTDGEKGGALFYISNQLSYKRRNDLKISSNRNNR